MSRRIRIWEKKRGDHRTGSQQWGTVGEIVLYAALFLIGILILIWLFSTSVLTQWSWRSWLVLLVPTALIFIGGGGLIFTIFQSSVSAERRAATIQRVKNLDLADKAATGHHQYACLPDASELTNSPGTTLAFRLPAASQPGWRLFALGAFCLCWNTLGIVFIVMAVQDLWSGQPKGLLLIIAIFFTSVGVATIAYFIGQLRAINRIGPTRIETSDHPFFPGRKYDILLAQAGHIFFKSYELLLVCEEVATYRQGTDTRTETRRVSEQKLSSLQDLEIPKNTPYELKCQLELDPNIMHSLKTEHNEIKWRLVVLGELNRRPEYQRSFPVIVYPSSCIADSI